MTPADAAAERRAAIEARLGEELNEVRHAAIRRLLDGGTVADVCTGSETRPGVHVVGHRLVAWDFDPAGGAVSVHGPDPD